MGVSVLEFEAACPAVGLKTAELTVSLVGVVVIQLVQLLDDGLTKARYQLEPLHDIKGLAR